MAYIGKQPLVGNYTVLDALTATTTDTYALTKNSVAVFPQTPANCIVSLNGVIQAPFDSYTISGSNIVFASALTGSDSIDFITVLGDVLNVGTVSDGTIGLAKLSATGTKDATTFLRGDNTFQTIGANTPAVSVYMDSLQIPSNTTLTKVNYNTEVLDSDNAFDTSTNRFTVPTGKNGYYLITAQVFTAGQSNNEYYSELQIRKNGSSVSYTSIATGSTSTGASSQKSVTAHSLINLVAGDYIEVYALIGVNSGTPQFYHGLNATQMSIVRIIE